MKWHNLLFRIMNLADDIQTIQRLTERIFELMTNANEPFSIYARHDARFYRRRLT